MEFLNDETGFLEESEDIFDFDDPYSPHESNMDSYEVESETSTPVDQEILTNLIYRYNSNINIRKVPVSIRIDSDILAWFKKDGNGYQTRINAALRAVMETEKSFSK